MFELHPAFPATSEAVGDLPLCHARLQADARFAWLVLIPRVPGVRELDDLPVRDRAALVEEVVRAGAAVRAVGEALGRPIEKLNIGALGNVTPQLHVHIVGRRADDPAWPGPVWGFGTPQAYRLDAQDTALAAARTSLGL
ncbi:MAG: HIT domain-containing protein [Phenylobacterium sp.]|nr:HIT domain-containing protein [Phenylobacterium sp.]